MRVLLLSFAVYAASLAPAVSANANSSGSGFIQRIYGSANPPYGFLRFCSAFPEDCAKSELREHRVNATPARLAELDQVNRAVNKAIEPITDLMQYGVEEWWTIPASGKGDCEEYVLVKRRALIGLDWPTSALLITVVLDENKQGHAILTARTDSGDLILDNKHDEIKAWYATPYTFIMRQSYLNPMVWVSLDPNHANSPPAIAGVKAKKS